MTIPLQALACHGICCVGSCNRRGRSLDWKNQPSVGGAKTFRSCEWQQITILGIGILKNVIRQLRPHIGNIFWSNCNTGIIALTALVKSVVFVRLGSKELYGQYLSVLAMVQLLSLVSVSGSRTVVFRAIAQNYDGVYRAATHFSFVRSLLGVPVLLGVAAVLYYVMSPVVGIGMAVAAIFFPFVTSLENWTSVLKGRVEFSKLSLANLLRYGTGLIAVAAAILLTNNLIAVLLTYFVVHSGFNVLYHVRCLASARNTEVDPGWRRQSYALTTMELSHVIFGQVDILLIAALLPMDRVAVYGLVMKLVAVFLTATKSTVEGIVPRLFRSDRVTVGYFYKFFVLSIVVSVIIAWLIRYPILWVYGSAYAELIPYTRLYMLAIPVYFLFAVVSHLMIKHQMNREINGSTILGIVTVIGLYVVLIPIYGIWGGIVASLLYFVVQMMAGLLFLRTRREKTGDPGGRGFSAAC